MKKLYTTFFCCIAALVLPFFANADTLEIAGADISYKWLNTTQYEVSLNIYTKCNYTSLDSVWIKVSSPDTNFKSYQKLAHLENAGPVRGLCAHVTSCDNPANSIPGIRKWVAKAIFSLSRQYACEYVFSWESCCRTKIITTGAASKHFYIDAYMRICENEKVSSPQFSADPNFIAAKNYCNKKHNPVEDKVGDTGVLYSFDLISPRQSADTDVNYDSPYSYISPFWVGNAEATPCHTLKINNEGTVNFNTSKEDASPLAFTLNKYDTSGVLQSRIGRDVVYVVINMSPNNSPIVSGVNGTTTARIQYIAGVSQCFTLNGFDTDPGDSIKLYASGVPAGATFTVEKDKKWPRATFCWSPADSQKRTSPYILQITAQDNATLCGEMENNGTTTKVFDLFVCPDSSENCMTGIEENNSILHLKIFPQPAQNYVYINMPENDKNISDLQVSDVLGRIFSTPYVWEGNKLKINTEKLSAGNYFIKILSKQNIYGSKLIISK